MTKVTLELTVDYAKLHDALASMKREEIVLPRAVAAIIDVVLTKEPPRNWRQPETPGACTLLNGFVNREVCISNTCNLFRRSCWGWQG
jgi:hypothetical protein